MVKCVVSSCLNREEHGEDRGISRAPKRFFSFPQDPARVKVWLAALREPDKQDWTQDHVICEDHFLPEDVSPGGVHPDAIPIMPPCLEEELGLDAWAEEPEDAWDQEPEEDQGWDQEPEEDQAWDMEEEEQEEDYGDQTQEEVNARDEEVKDEENREMKEQEEEEHGEDEGMDVNKEEEQQQQEEMPGEAQMATERITGAADSVFPADGDTAPPADGDVAALVEEDAAPPVGGDVAALVEEDAAPPVGGDVAALVEGVAAPLGGDTAPPVEEVVAALLEGGTAPPVGGDAEAPVGGDTEAPVGGDAEAPVGGVAAPPADHCAEYSEATLTSSSAPALAPPTLPSSGEPMKTVREDWSLLLLTRSFLELLLSGDGSLDVREAAKRLRCPKRRVYDVTNILMGVDLLKREAMNRVRWTGKCPISSFLWEKQKMQKESEKLKQVEDALDGLIKTCAQQLFSMTDDKSNAKSAFVTYDDVVNLAPFQDQTVMVVKAPEETKLEVPAPKEDSIQVHLKSGSGPISVLTFEVWPDVYGKIPRAFRAIQHSHINTSVLQTESSSQSSVL